MRPGRDGGQFGNQSMRANFAVHRITHVQIIMVKSRKCPDDTHHNGHGVRPAIKATIEVL